MERQRADTFSQSSDLWTNHPGNKLVYVDAAVLETASRTAERPPVLPNVQTMQKGLEISAPTTGEATKLLSKQAKEATNADLIVDEIHHVVANAGGTPETTPKPTNETMGKAISVLSTVKDSLLGKPDVDTLYGEINLTWNEGAKQVILICCADRDPLIHHHQHIKGKPSKHGIEKATAGGLARWLRWLHG